MSEGPLVEAGYSFTDPADMPPMKSNWAAFGPGAGRWSAAPRRGVTMAATRLRRDDGFTADGCLETGRCRRSPSRPGSPPPFAAWPATGYAASRPSPSPPGR